MISKTLRTMTVKNTTKQARKEVIELTVINGSVDEREFCYLSKTVSC